MQVKGAVIMGKDVSRNWSLYNIFKNTSRQQCLSLDLKHDKAELELLLPLVRVPS